MCVTFLIPNAMVYKSKESSSKSRLSASPTAKLSAKKQW